MTKFVYSTLTADQIYRTYEKTANDLQIEKGSVFIKGGTGVANDRVSTPIGVETQISDEDAQLLEKNAGFLQHRENGFVQIKDSKVDTERAASDMQTRDGSAPLVPGDYEGTTGPKPTVDAVSAKKARGE